MLTLIAFFVGLLASPTDVAQLQATAPHSLKTIEQAREHLGAARTAAFLTRTDPTILLSIAWHESRYRVDVSGPEVGHRVSCGVMATEPRRPPCPAQTVAQSYLEGAAWVRRWLEVSHGNLRRALIGYGGGYRALRICARQRHPACGFPAVIVRRAQRIRASNHARSLVQI